MAHKFKISPFGYRLIKAYEGFRAQETTLISGQQIIGYGHRYSLDEEPIITKQKAGELLKLDLQPYEDLVNSNIYAPLNQSQFDALVSLAFNIGPRAFIGSTTLSALNNGRPLDAAAGFDEWRKSIIGGKTYVIDALVRRRTAEKALFLKPDTGVVAAPRLDLPPQKDTDYAEQPTLEPVFDLASGAGIVEQLPYDKVTQAADDDNTDQERRSDINEISEDQHRPELDTAEPSPIAVAAAEVSERLDNLVFDLTAQDQTIEDEDAEDTPNTTDTATSTDRQNTFLPANDDGGIREAQPVQATNPQAVLTDDQNIASATEPEGQNIRISGNVAALILGLCATIFGVWKWFLTPRANLEPFMAFIAPASITIGAMVVLGSLYYLLKSWVRR